MQCRNLSGRKNAKFGSNFEMPVVYYGQLISVAYGRSVLDAALDGRVIKTQKLEESAAIKNI
jgi:heterodisulfide reductase subunit B